MIGHERSLRSYPINSHPQQNDFDFASLPTAPPFRVSLLKRWSSLLCALCFSVFHFLCSVFLCFVSLCFVFLVFLCADSASSAPLRYLFPSFLPRPNFPLCTNYLSCYDCPVQYCASPPARRFCFSPMFSWHRHSCLCSFPFRTRPAAKVVGSSFRG
jgi:hypothetical protein